MTPADRLARLDARITTRTAELARLTKERRELERAISFAMGYSVPIFDRALRSAMQRAGA